MLPDRFGPTTDKQGENYQADIYKAKLCLSDYKKYIPMAGFLTVFEIKYPLKFLVKIIIHYVFQV